MNFRYFIVWLYTTLFTFISTVLAYESLLDIYWKVGVIVFILLLPLGIAYGLSKQEEKEIKHLLNRDGQKEKDYWVKR